MTGRKTQAQTIIDLIDQRLETILGLSGKVKSPGLSQNTGFNQTENVKAFEDVSFITRNEHRGGGHGDLPDSRPVYDLDCEIVPSRDGAYRIGLSDRAWKIVYAHRVDLKSDTGWLKLDVDYFFANIAFKTCGSKVLLHGYGNHRVKGSDGKPLFSNTTTISINRPVPYKQGKPYTGIKAWRFDPWYSKVDINNETGIGSRRSCVSDACPSKPGVEAEVVDTGNPAKVYIRFRNFLPYPVVVGVAVSY